MVSQTERGETVDSTLQLATTAFNSNDYTTAARYLAQAKQFKPGDSFIDFYYGVALMHNGPLSQSRAILTTVFNGESVFKYEAAFYLALTYLKEKNTGACREWLEKIPADAGNYTKAQELLKKL
jgi:thioredoxin-like negative regulator of GroEL